MKGLPLFVLGLAASRLVVPVSAGAAPAATTDDSCTATGHGTSYTLSVTIPSDAPAQYGFAVSSRGGRVTNIALAADQGIFSTRSLPNGASGAWITLSPVLPGSAVLDVTTDGPIDGQFTVTPASSSSPAYFAPLPCPLSGTAAPPKASFTVGRLASYDPGARAWRLRVTIPGAGTVYATEPEPSVGTGSSKQVTQKPLVQSRRVGLSSAGTVTLTLRPTARGAAQLTTKRALAVRLEVVYAPKGGRAGTKIVDLTLEK
jgi:hypothetical protein